MRTGPEEQVRADSSADRWVVREPAGLGGALAFFRRKRQLTQADVAQEVGMHRQYLSNLERGEVSGQVERLMRVVRLLGLELEVRERGGG
jgi:transcriptional regulator with XRE-family HTH domain